MAAAGRMGEAAASEVRLENTLAYPMKTAVSLNEDFCETACLHRGAGSAVGRGTRAACGRTWFVLLPQGL
jgi:hypothetical protein